MNSTIFSGRLTKDPVYTAPKKEGGYSVARFTLAVENKHRKDDKPDWIPHVVFGKSADALVKYVKKGMKIITKGHISTDDYTTETGDKIYTWCNIVDEWEFAESKRDGSPANMQEPYVPYEQQQMPPQNYQQPQQPMQNQYPQQAPQYQQQYQQMPPQQSNQQAPQSGYQQMPPQGYQQPQQNGYQQQHTAPPSNVSFNNDEVPDGFLNDLDGDGFFG